MGRLSGPGIPQGVIFQLKACLKEADPISDRTPGAFPSGSEESLENPLPEWTPMLAAIRSRRGFSLIELVIVVLILGIIAAIAIPRMSRGAKGAQDSSVASNLSVLRNAIDMYHTEHGAFPLLAKFATQLTEYSDDSGATNPTADATHIYGPYLRAVPALPVGAAKGSTAVAATAGGATDGWVYDQATGTIKANSDTAKDTAGVLYSTY